MEAEMETGMNQQGQGVGGRAVPQRWLAVVATVWTGFAFTIFTSMAANYSAVWYVTQSTESAMALSLVYVCAFLPQGLLSPVGGMAADRFNRKTIIIIADAFVALVALSAGILIEFNSLSFGLILAVVSLCSVAQAFRTPAFNAAMPLIVPEKYLLKINTLDNILSSVAMICAPALGIFLYTGLGFQSVMFLNAAGAAAAALTILCARIPTVVSEHAASQGAAANMKEGLNALIANKGLLLLVLGITVGMMAYAPIDSMLPLIVSTQFAGDGYMASLVAGVFGAGMLIGSVALMVGNGKHHLVAIIVSASLVVGAATFVAGSLPSGMFAMFVAMIGVMAAACAGFNGPMMTLIQRHVDEDKLGRVMGLFMMCMGLGVPLGTALGGALAEHVGVTTFFMIDGLIVLILGVALALPKCVRALDKD